MILPKYGNNLFVPIADTCSQKKDEGICPGNVPRFYFNKRRGRCELFSYGGCGGNTNNFETQDECVAHCGGPLDEVLHAVVSGESSHYSLLHEVARDHSNGLPYFILLDHSTNCQIANWHLARAWTCNLLQ